MTLAGSAAKSSGTVTYAWRLDAPASSNAALSSTSTAAPTFVPDVGGEYFATLFVRDACGNSAPSTTVITVVNHAPVASAGPDRQAMPGDTVTLDGRGSADPDPDNLRYDWSLVSRPAGSNASLSNAAASTPTFTPDAFGTYVAVLVVSDGEDVSEPVQVVVKAGVTGPNGSCAPAAPPVANAGPDQNNLFPFSSAPLDGSASTSGRPGTLTFNWTIASGPAGHRATIDQPHAVRPFLQFLDKVGTYVVTLVVNDGCVDSAPATVRITRPNSPPQLLFINTPFPQPVPLLAPFRLNGAAFDSDGDLLTFQWAIVSHPDGSTAALDNPTAAAPAFAPDVVGTYTFSLVVSDAVSSSPKLQGSVTVANLPPVARVGPDQAVTIGTTVTVDGSASSDPSLQPLTHAWTLQRPSTSAATLSGADSPKPTFTPDVPGVYRAQLIVSARGIQSQPATTSVGAWPSVTRLTHRVTDAAYSKGLDRIVMVASDQSLLYLLDPRGASEDTVTLSHLPTSVGLDPSGLFAVVGHANAISHVDLQARSVLRDVAVLGEIQSLTLGNNNFAYAFLNGPVNDHVRLLAAPVVDGLSSSLIISPGLTGAGRGRFQAGNATLYVSANAGFFGGTTVEEYIINNGLLAQLARPAGASIGTCGDIWLSGDGTRLFTRCAGVFNASNTSTDLTAVGTGSLAHSQNANLFLRHLSDSGAAGEISAVASADDIFFPVSDDRTLRRWAAIGLTARDSVPFPTETTGTVVSRWQGRFVFYRSDGSERYVLMQVDPTSGAAPDFGFVTF